MRGLAIVMTATLAGCFSLTGSAGLQLGARRQVGVAAEASVDLHVPFDDRTALRLSVSPGIWYDGALGVTGLFGLGLLRQPDGAGLALRAGPRTGVASRWHGPGTWSWGGEVTVLPWTRVLCDARFTRDPRQRHPATRGWLHVGTTLQVLRATTEDDGLDPWLIRWLATIDVTAIQRGYARGVTPGIGNDP
jgi:hypothetical protein